MRTRTSFTGENATCLLSGQRSHESLGCGGGDRGPIANHGTGCHLEQPCTHRRCLDTLLCWFVLLVVKGFVKCAVGCSYLARWCSRWGCMPRQRLEHATCLRILRAFQGGDGSASSSIAENHDEAAGLEIFIVTGNLVWGRRSVRRLGVKWVTDRSGGPSLLFR